LPAATAADWTGFTGQGAVTQSNTPKNTPQWLILGGFGSGCLFFLPPRRRILEKKGYLVKKRNPDDARNITLQLTSEGKQAVPEMSLFANELRQCVLDFDDGVQETLLITLLELINQLQENGHISMQRMCFSCRYFVRQADIPPYYCQLLTKTLKEVDLRINCLEHRPKE
jgi:hypothetical protein